MLYPSRQKERFLAKRGFKYIAGIDEAGRGALAGPIVAAAVIMDISKKKLLIKDSKQLRADQREELYKLIVNEALGVGVGIIQPIRIDKIGIGLANRIAMERAVQKLSIDPDFLLIDYFRINSKVPFENIKKGDQKIYSISAASIIAKVTRDRILINSRKKFPFFSFHEHKGYGTRRHFEEIKKNGVTSYHRQTFKLVQN